MSGGPSNRDTRGPAVQTFRPCVLCRSIALKRFPSLILQSTLLPPFLPSVDPVFFSLLCRQRVFSLSIAAVCSLILRGSHRGNEFSRIARTRAQSVATFLAAEWGLVPYEYDATGGSLVFSLSFSYETTVSKYTVQPPRGRFR